jgi:hypothetical protein
MRKERGSDTKSFYLALIFIIFTFLGTAGADDKLYLYTVCSGGQGCIEIAYDNGVKESVQADPWLVLSKNNIRSAFVRRSGGFERRISLDMALDKEVSAKITKNFGRELIFVFNNNIIDSPSIRSIAGTAFISFRQWGPLLEKAPWLKDLVEESYNSNVGRTVYIYVISSLGIILAAFILVFFPRNKLVSNQVS